MPSSITELRLVRFLWTLVLSLAVGSGAAACIASPGEDDSEPLASSEASVVRGLAAPANLAVVSARGTSVDLAWVDTNKDESGYEIERSDATSGNSFVRVAGTGKDGKSYHDGSVLPGAIYQYRVRAFKKNGAVSAYSNVVAVAAMASPIVTPTLLAFGDQAAGTTSAARSISITNPDPANPLPFGVSLQQAGTGGMIPTVRRVSSMSPSPRTTAFAAPTQATTTTRRTSSARGGGARRSMPSPMARSRPGLRRCVT